MEDETDQSSSGNESPEWLPWEYVGSKRKATTRRFLAPEDVARARKSKRSNESSQEEHANPSSAAGNREKRRVTTVSILHDENDHTLFTESTWWMVDTNCCNNKILKYGATALVVRCMRKFKWSETFARRVARSYRQFLLLKKEETDQAFSEQLLPCRQVNRMWLEHITSVSQYILDCVFLVGRVVDHDPDVVELNENEKKKRQNYTREVIHGRFGNEYDKVLWEDFALTGPNKNAPSMIPPPPPTTANEEPSDIQDIRQDAPPLRKNRPQARIMPPKVSKPENGVATLPTRKKKPPPPPPLPPTYHATALKVTGTLPLKDAIKSKLPINKPARPPPPHQKVDNNGHIQSKPRVGQKVIPGPPSAPRNELNQSKKDGPAKLADYVISSQKSLQISQSAPVSKGPPPPAYSVRSVSTNDETTLEPGWTRHWSTRLERWYLFNQKTNENKWETSS